MAADPDRIEAPVRARRVPAPPGPVGDGKGPGRLAGPKLVHLIGMKREPAAQCVLEIALVVRDEQKIIPKLALHAPVAGMSIRSLQAGVEFCKAYSKGICSLDSSYRQVSLNRGRI